MQTKGEITMKIKVTPEGRDGLWVADKNSVVDYLHGYKFELIHNIMPGPLMLGADWSKDSVIEKTKAADRICVLTGDSFFNNLKHALSVIVDNKLLMFDIGEITESDLLIA